MRKLAGLFGLLILTGAVSSASPMPSDALDSYREAVRLSKAQDWAGVTAALEKGNAVPVLKFAEKTRSNAYSALRQLCRDGIAAAPALGSEKGKHLLDSLRVLAKHVAKAEPRDSMTLLVGIALHAVIERGTVEFYEKTGQKTAAKQSGTSEIQRVARTCAKRDKSTAGLHGKTRNPAPVSSHAKRYERRNTQNIPAGNAEKHCCMA